MRMGNGKFEKVTKEELDKHLVYPVKVGGGKKVHAGFVRGYFTRRFSDERRRVLGQICGAGTKLNRQGPTVREITFGNREINCTKCLQSMKAYGRNYKLGKQE